MKDTIENEKLIKKQKAVRENLIDQFIEYRKMRSLTQEELAQVMGIKRPNISRFEAGQCNPTLDLLVKIADSIGLEIKIELVDRGEGSRSEKRE